MRLAVLTIALSLGTAALAQDAPPPDEPAGAPYRVGGGTRPEANAVPLRDFMSVRIDQNQAELISRIDHLEQELRLLIDERDRQYAQRFEAQQQALKDALQAAKEAGANALQSAKEAVIKAEEAANKRFEGVNEFRATLSDQAQTFMGKAEADARLKALEQDTAKNSARIDSMQARGEGASSLWGFIAGGVGLLIAVAMFAMALSNRQKAVAAGK